MLSASFTALTLWKISLYMKVLTTEHEHEDAYHGMQKDVCYIHLQGCRCYERASVELIILKRKSAWMMLVLTGVSKHSMPFLSEAVTEAADYIDHFINYGIWPCRREQPNSDLSTGWHLIIS